MTGDRAHNNAGRAGDAPRIQGLRGCRRCGLVQRVPVVPRGMLARCPRCDDVVWTPRRTGRNSLCMALAASGLLLFPMGVLMPVLRLQQMGHAHAASIWDGTVSLLSKGHYAVGLVVLVCSVILPIVKLTGLMLLCGRPPLPTRHAAALYRGVELAGKWGMIDVLLVAVLVASLKLGDVVEVQPGPGLAAFTACVVLSLLATGAFDPHGLWEPEPPGAEPARGG